jgi:hypothetical protein
LWDVINVISMELLCETYAVMLRDALNGAAFIPAGGIKIVPPPVVPGKKMSVSYSRC